jgi:ADP-ribosyl-[dinitrogen reductase] hydrolase
MLTAAIGDYIGSHFEHIDAKGYDVELYHEDSEITDDSVLMAATCEALLYNLPFDKSLRKWAKKHPNAGYGPGFSSWLNNDGHKESGYSYGNGASTRSIPIGFFAKSEEEALRLANLSASTSHRHPEGIKGAEAVSLSIYLLRNGFSCKDVVMRMHSDFDYLLFFDIEDLHENYGFDSSAENTVPLAIFLGLEAKSFEDCIRKCLYVGGDTDTIMSISCAIYESRGDCQVPQEMIDNLDSHLKDKHGEIRDIISKFCKQLNLINLK